MTNEKENPEAITLSARWRALSRMRRLAIIAVGAHLFLIIFAAALASEPPTLLFAVIVVSDVFMVVWLTSSAAPLPTLGAFITVASFASFILAQMIYGTMALGVERMASADTPAYFAYAELSYARDTGEPLPAHALSSLESLETPMSRLLLSIWYGTQEQYADSVDQLAGILSLKARYPLMACTAASNLIRMADPAAHVASIDLPARMHDGQPLQEWKAAFLASESTVAYQVAAQPYAAQAAEIARSWSCNSDYADDVAFLLVGLDHLESRWADVISYGVFSQKKRVLAATRGY